MEELSYLVMTAADAASHNTDHPHGICSLNQLLEERSKSHPDTICVGFTEKNDDAFTCSTLTYKQLYDKVCKTAYLLHTNPQYGFQARQKNTPSSDEASSSSFVVGLLAPSCEEFLVETFALFRLGWSVLLIAPQNTAEDIAGLCKNTTISRLLYHQSMEAAAKKAETAANGGLAILPTLAYKAGTNDEVAKDYENARSKLSYEDESETDCIIFHSSGSSGTPKPIPQKHRIWTKAACCKPHSPSFTTTPLFHGGISDLLRAMMSHSTLYMYPSTFPITASNLLSAFKACPETPTSFLSVPYILEMLSDVEEGMEKLKSFELVSTGGSPLNPQLGDLFAEKGIKLVSRYGSSESGFLMTSLRDFVKDKEWNYLRPSAGKEWLTFEDQGDGIFELVVPKEWPTRNKSNRSDGSYATSDLFKKHPTIKDAWMLCGRSDDVILMSNGEKASPAPLESAIRKHKLVKEALVIGVNRSTLGVAIIPTTEGINAGDLRSAVLEANKVAPAHAQIPPELVLVLPHDASFPKASKGTVQRGKAYEALSSQISALYEKYENAGMSNGDDGRKMTLAPTELLEFILDKLKEVMQMQEVRPDDDLFNLGLTSTQALRVRNLLKTKLDLGIDGKLPPNIVYECSTARRLAQYITDQSEGKQVEDQDLHLMRELMDGPLASFEHGHQRSNGQRHDTNGDHTRTCLLTGGTGSLGAHIIANLLGRNDDWRIVCLVRAETSTSAHKRVSDNLRKHKIALPEGQVVRLNCLGAKLQDDCLGLACEEYEKLSTTVDLVIHAAWPVHFRAGLQSFVPHLQGLHNLISLSRRNGASFYFCSSSSSVLASPSSAVEERIYTDPKDAVSIGYARSKFVAESICASALDAGGPGEIGVLRLGQLSGDTKHGMWKAEEGWPQLFASADLVGCLPDLDETLNWLPIDKAAEAILDIAINKDNHKDGIPVYNVVSTSHKTTYRDALAAAKQAGLQFEVVPPSVWLQRLEAACAQSKQHSCLKMLDTWQRNYGKISDGPPRQPTFAMDRVERYTSALSEPPTNDLLKKIFRYWESDGLLKLQPASQ